MRKAVVATVLMAILALLLLALSAGCGDDDDDDSGGSDPMDDDDTSDDDDDNDDDDDSDDDDDDDDTTGGVEILDLGDTIILRNDALAVHYNLPLGRFSVFSRKGAEGSVVNAEALVLSHVILPKTQIHSSAVPYLSWDSVEGADNLGQFTQIRITRQKPDAAKAYQIELVQKFKLYENDEALILDVDVTNLADGNQKIGAIYPIFAAPPGGYLWFGENKNVRVLCNGALNYLEFIAPMMMGTLPAHADWSATIYNLESGDSLLTGSLTFDQSQPVVYYGPNSKAGEGQTLHVADQFEPAKTLETGQTLSSENTVLYINTESPFDALETYAYALKDWLEISLWAERHPETGVFAGWNSWSGSGSSGGYGTNIDEQIIVDNMDFADRELRRWGMNLFPLDDGYQTVTGDWDIDTDHFPDHGTENGVEWLLHRAKDMGFYTGLWIEGFNAYYSSNVVANHPEYFADPWLEVLMQQSQLSFDFTRPDAAAYMTGILEEMKSWGLDWLKLDFAYLAAETTGWDEPNITRCEFYRTGIKLFRDVLGDDVFFLNVAVKGWSYGLVDGLRLTLDTMPSFDGENPSDPIGNQGLKPMYRDSARAYWLNHRVFENHHDLIFFREHKDTTVTPLTLNESQVFATALALQGGIFKIGDKIVDLEPEHVDTLRRIMPIVPLEGRPIDLFEREFPELWVLHSELVEGSYIVGLLNWGTNRDLTQTPYADMPDQDRDMNVNFVKAGIDETKTYLAFEYWTQEFLGEVNGNLEYTTPARYPRVVTLRPKLDHPQFLCSNRHVLCGDKVVQSAQWNEDDNTFELMVEGSVGTDFAPFTHQVSLYANGYTVSDVTTDSVEDNDVKNLTWDQDGDLITITFEVESLVNPAPQWHSAVMLDVEF